MVAAQEAGACQAALQAAQSPARLLDSLLLLAQVQRLPLPCTKAAAQPGCRLGGAQACDHLRSALLCIS